jgi:hypothetical protein
MTSSPKKGNDISIKDTIQHLEDPDKLEYEEAKSALLHSLLVKIPASGANSEAATFPTDSRRDAGNDAAIAALKAKQMPDTAKRNSNRETFGKARSSKKGTALERRTQELNQGTTVANLTPVCMSNSFSKRLGDMQTVNLNLHKDEEALEVLRQSHAIKTAKEMSFYANQGRNSIGTFETLKRSRCDEDCPPRSCQQQHSRLLAHMRWADELRHIAKAAVNDGHFQGDGFSYAIELTASKSNNIYHTLQPTKKDAEREAATYCLGTGVTDVELDESEDLNQNYELPLSELAAIAVPANKSSATVTKAADLVPSPEPKKISPLLSIKMYGTVSKGSYSTVTKFVNPGVDFPSLKENTAFPQRKAEEEIEDTIRQQKAPNLFKNKQQGNLDAVKRESSQHNNPSGYSHTPDPKQSIPGSPLNSNQKRSGRRGENLNGRENHNQGCRSNASCLGLQSRNGFSLDGCGESGGPRNYGGVGNPGVSTADWKAFIQWKDQKNDPNTSSPQFQDLRKALPPQVASPPASIAESDGFQKVTHNSQRCADRRYEDSSHSGNSSRSNGSRNSKD